MACAMSSFPVPVSPSIKTVESVAATTRTMSRTRPRAALVPTILGEFLSQISSPSNPVFAANPSGITKDAVRFRASLTQFVCADILLIPSLVDCGFAVHKSPCLTVNSRLVLCRSDRACNLDRISIALPLATRVKHSSSGNYALYHFQLLREIWASDGIHCPKLILSNSQQRAFGLY